MKIKTSATTKQIIYLALVFSTTLLLHRIEIATHTSSAHGRVSVRKEEESKEQQSAKRGTNDCYIQKADIMYTMQRIMSSELLMTPYPHSITTDFFSPRIYDCIVKHVKPMRSQRNLKRISLHMSPKEIEQARRSYNELNTPSHLDRIERVYNLKKESKNFWQEFPAILNNHRIRNLWLQRFSDPLSLRTPSFEPLKFQTYSRQLLTIDSTNYAILPHTDTVDKLVTILIYLPENTRNETNLGTLLLQKKNSTQTLHISGKQRALWEYFEVVKQAPFQPNVALAFSACEESWHAVKEVGKMKESRISLQTFLMKKNTKGKEKVGPCSTIKMDENRRYN